MDAMRLRRTTSDGRGPAVQVHFPQPVSQVFDFLADPATRPRWQSSLRAVELLTPGPPGVGTRWRDVTWPGLRPELEITAWETGRVWAEHGSWRGIEVDLRLRFTDLTSTGAHGTLVAPTTTVDAAGWRRPVEWGMATVGPLVARDDLRRARRILGR